MGLTVQQVQLAALQLIRDPQAQGMRLQYVQATLLRWEALLVPAGVLLLTPIRGVEVLRQVQTLL